MIGGSVGCFYDFRNPGQYTGTGVGKFLGNEVYEVIEIGSQGRFVLGNAEMLADKVADPAIGTTGVRDKRKVDVHGPVLASRAYDRTLPCPGCGD
jgi:hypothetical protein